MKLTIKVLSEDGWREVAVDTAIQYGVPQELIEDVLFNKKNRSYKFKQEDEGWCDGAAQIKFTWVK